MPLVMSTNAHYTYNITTEQVKIITTGEIPGAITSRENHTRSVSGHNSIRYVVFLLIGKTAKTRQAKLKHLF